MTKPIQDIIDGLVRLSDDMKWHGGAAWSKRVPEVKDAVEALKAMQWGQPQVDAWKRLNEVYDKILSDECVSVLQAGAAIEGAIYNLPAPHPSPQVKPE